MDLNGNGGNVHMNAPKRTSKFLQEKFLIHKMNGITQQLRKGDPLFVNLDVSRCRFSFITEISIH